VLAELEAAGAVAGWDALGAWASSVVGAWLQCVSQRAHAAAEKARILMVAREPISPGAYFRNGAGLA
jgi:hypothetical protein